MWLLVLGLLACSGETAAPAPAPAPAAAPVAAPAEPAAIVIPSPSENRFAARHILVTWQGSVGALPNVTRTREEARARIDEALAKVNAGGDFAELAKAYSDDATGPRGGDLGGFGRGEMVAPFEAALASLKVGEVSAVVETPFGFHVIKREALREIHVEHLLVSFAGAVNAPAGVTRTHDEAKARAEEALTKVGATDAEWAAAVRTYSDAPLKEDAGDIGWMTPGQMADVLDKAAFTLEPGAVSAVVETPVGFHVMRRLE